MKNSSEKVWLLTIIIVNLHRYPENNLFTLKGLIPIEDMKRSPVRVIALFFFMQTYPLPDIQEAPFHRYTLTALAGHDIKYHLVSGTHGFGTDTGEIADALVNAVIHYALLRGYTLAFHRQQCREQRR